MCKLPRPTAEQLHVHRLGEAKHHSPLALSTQDDDMVANFTTDDERVLFDLGGADVETAFEVSGPRVLNYFRGSDVTAGIVTCGGLCPGMNDVIRALVLTLWHGYRVRTIIGFRYGLRGMVPDTDVAPRRLAPDDVHSIQLEGGTLLGSSRGPQSEEEIVDQLQQLGVNALFVVGGDGGMRAAQAIYREIGRRSAQIALIGVPKTIDNDLPYVERTFGFDTAVALAAQAIRAAHVEARGAPNGVGLVRLMGRQAGFIASAATLATREVNLLLIPELPFELEGPHGLIEWLRSRLAGRGHAVIVVAEGAGQQHLDLDDTTDASGNPKLGDIGIFLRDRLRLALRNGGVNVKYIDPSYMIRAAPATATDAIFCGRLAENAVHAALNGCSGALVGIWGGRFTHVPLALVNSTRKRISLDGTLWRSVVDATGQPARLV